MARCRRRTGHWPPRRRPGPGPADTAKSSRSRPPGPAEGWAAALTSSSGTSTGSWPVPAVGTLVGAAASGEPEPVAALAARCPAAAPTATGAGVPALPAGTRHALAVARLPQRRQGPRFHHRVHALARQREQEDGQHRDSSAISESLPGQVVALDGEPAAARRQHEALRPAVHRRGQRLERAPVQPRRSTRRTARRAAGCRRSRGPRPRSSPLPGRSAGSWCRSPRPRAPGRPARTTCHRS